MCVLLRECILLCCRAMTEDRKRRIWVNVWCVWMCIRYSYCNNWDYCCFVVYCLRNTNIRMNVVRTWHPYKTTTFDSHGNAWHSTNKNRKSPAPGSSYDSEHGQREREKNAVFHLLSDNHPQEARYVTSNMFKLFEFWKCLDRRTWWIRGNDFSKSNIVITKMCV